MCAVYVLHIICFGFERSVTQHVSIFRQTARVCSYHIRVCVCAHAFRSVRACRIQESLIGQVRSGGLEENTLPVGQIAVVHHCIKTNKSFNLCDVLFTVAALL